MSAYLHSSTMVKAGSTCWPASPTLGGTRSGWGRSVGSVGAISATGAILRRWDRTDLKRLLAYSTVAVLGLLTLLLGLGTPIAARAFAVTLLAHAFYKGRSSWSPETWITRPGRAPWSASAACGAPCRGDRCAGGRRLDGRCPPLFGFLAKETAYEAALEAPRCGVGSSAPPRCWPSVSSSRPFASGLQAFVGTRRAAGRAPTIRRLRCGSRRPSLPPRVSLPGCSSARPSGRSSRLRPVPSSSSRRRPVSPSGTASRRSSRSQCTHWCRASPSSGARASSPAAALRAAGAAGSGPCLGPAWQVLLPCAAWQTRLLQSGSLRRYLGITLGDGDRGAVGAGRRRSTSSSPRAGRPRASAVPARSGGGCGSDPARATPLVSVAALGAVGFGVALLFLVYSAPDLALTQLVIEVLTVVLLVFVLRRLPRRRGRPARVGRHGRACVGRRRRWQRSRWWRSGAAGRAHLGLLQRAERPDRARPQRGQRDPRRLPRARHLRRDRRARQSPRSASWRCCAAARPAPRPPPPR